MRNPKWHRDEIILALDVYFSIEHGSINSNNPEIIALSNLLNRLPIHEIRPDKAKFRNANGASLKLGNFLAIDPSYSGKGLHSFSKLDKLVFDEFYNDKETLKNIATKIKTAVRNDAQNFKLYKIEDEDEELSFKEGKVLYKLHKYRERNPKVNKLKKDQYLKKYGKLNCEVCDFDFEEEFGELGKGFIECHHRKPLSEIDGESETDLKDLSLVCSNCHRMLHRKLDAMSIDALKEIKAIVNK